MSRKVAILGGGRIGEALLSGLLSSGWREASEIVVTSARGGTDRRAARALRHRGHRRQRGGGRRRRHRRHRCQAAGHRRRSSQIARAYAPSRPSFPSPPRSRPRTSRSGSPKASRSCARCRTRPRPCTRHGRHRRGRHAGDEHLDLAEELLAHLGRVVRVPERSMDAITAVSGSGPPISRCSPRR